MSNNNNNNSPSSYQDVIDQELGIGDCLGLERQVCKCCNKEKSKSYDFYSSNKRTCKSCIAKKKKQHITNNYPHFLWSLAKQRASEKGLQFTITPSDIVIPTLCPVLLFPLVVGKNNNQNKFNSPTIDRIDNSKGYTPDNICVISYRANSLKSNATTQELTRVLAYMQGNLIF